MTWGKTAIARVYLRPGTGTVTVNKRTIDDYFPNEVLKMIVRQPLELVQMADRFDINVTVEGGGITGQAGAIRHGISRALIALLENHQQADGSIAIPKALRPYTGFDRIGPR